MSAVNGDRLFKRVWLRVMEDRRRLKAYSEQRSRSPNQFRVHQRQRRLPFKNLIVESFNDVAIGDTDSNQPGRYYYFRIQMVAKHILHSVIVKKRMEQKSIYVTDETVPVSQYSIAIFTTNARANSIPRFDQSASSRATTRHATYTGLIHPLLFHIQLITSGLQKCYFYAH